MRGLPAQVAGRRVLHAGHHPVGRVRYPLPVAWAQPSASGMGDRARPACSPLPGTAPAACPRFPQRGRGLLPVCLVPVAAGAGLPPARAAAEFLPYSYPYNRCAAARRYGDITPQTQIETVVRAQPAC